MDLYMEKELEKIEKETITVEDFIAKSLELLFDYEDILKYLDTIHKG